MTHSPEVLVLFSGGLDSLLSALLLLEQGVRVRCLHAVSPFFGNKNSLPLWSARYGLDIHALDVGDEFVEMLRAGPTHGYGKIMNPCVDCKILLLRRARQYMEKTGAQALATGEVLGQRPMSQRRDAMNVIAREAGVDGLLVRPLCAQRLPPTPVEKKGIVDRARLLGFCGRGRSEQLALAARFRLEHIPTPAGGCRLTERETARRYWSVLTRLAQPQAADFALANLGRQFWGDGGNERKNEGGYWLCIGRNCEDNAKLEASAREADALLVLADAPGPVGLARGGAQWPDGALAQACALTASYAPKAMGQGAGARVRTNKNRVLTVMPERMTFFEETPTWETTRPKIRATTRQLINERRNRSSAL
ncbi:MAG: tRNA(5-methylaminomethyl-2-thiouridylate) methyltransferase [Candidatus Desulfovibrio kirbyi]|jgi:hypothetical protein|uniref:tRNA(5-methylaminomethyl-2-thiouridylate) methyltransferase n=1 Tax=Candidatus Desulfovibrio kirbyi TaxID=2696086 RepID=A0A6L2R4S4_9BACT|nr:tRNA(5-methylaminomethyl-2-thiouridylate) methyltransferase [Desulfovibrio sp.]GFH62561.1 MAG: tRNA(5-methylaminomethyl-2-thiouridylate) methyltransferase [Candidatus Desulfovibrio kirbyi]